VSARSGLSSVGGTVVGRSVELGLLDAALRSGRHVLVVGSHGVGKSFLVEHACCDAGLSPERINGGVVSTLGQVIGHHDPARLLRRGFDGESFVPGPLLRAVVTGRPLCIDDAGELPSSVLGALVTVMSEDELTVPRVGTFRVAEGFVVLACAGTGDSGAEALPLGFLDRVVRIEVGYQSAEEERRIVEVSCPDADPWIRDRAVDLVRASRHHPEIASGSSIRGAVDLVAVAGCLANPAANPAANPTGGPVVWADADAPGRAWLSAVGLRAAYLALSSKIRLWPDVKRVVELVLRDLWADVEITASRSTGTARGHQDLPPSSIVGAPLGDDPGPLDPEGGWDEDPADEGADPAAAFETASPTAVVTGSRRLAARGRTTPTANAPAAAPADVAQETVAAFSELARGSARRRGLGRDRAAPTEAIDLTELERVAAQVIVRRARESAAPLTAPGGRLATVRYNFRSDDLDLDRTIDSLIENPLPDHRDLWVHDRVPRQRGVVLMLDVSGSMRGPRLVEVATAAVATAMAVPEDELAVVAFGDTAEILHGGLTSIAPADLARRITAMRPAGLTDLAAGLRMGRGALAELRSQIRLGVVMTDGVANAGPDPLPVAHTFDRLNVLATTRSPWRLNECRRLATAGGGVCETYGDVSQLPTALSRLLAP